MCLQTIRPDLEKEVNKLKKDSKGYIKLWKVFSVNRKDELRGIFYDRTFYDGKNTSKEGPGFHCFTSITGAKNWWPGLNLLTVPVKVKPTWIKNVGTQAGRRAVTCKHIII